MLFVVGLFAQYYSHSVLEAGLTIASVLYGGLLGVFLLGLAHEPARRRLPPLPACAPAWSPHLLFNPTWPIPGTFLSAQRVTFVYRPRGGHFHVKIAEARSLSAEVKETPWPKNLLLQQAQLTAGSSAAGQPQLRAFSGLWSAVSIVIGTVIGSGMFLVPRRMIAEVGSTRNLFFVWILGGLLSLFGALTYAELAAAMPEAGGEYVFLSEAYGPFWGYLYSWTQLAVAKSGSIATLGSGFYLYLSVFFPALGNSVFILHYPIGPAGGPLEIHYGQLVAIGDHSDPVRYQLRGCRSRR